jgi:murein endopeptidase
MVWHTQMAFIGRALCALFLLAAGAAAARDAEWVPAAAVAPSLARPAAPVPHPAQEGGDAQPEPAKAAAPQAPAEAAAPDGSAARPPPAAIEAGATSTAAQQRPPEEPSSGSGEEAEGPDATPAAEAEDGDEPSEAAQAAEAPQAAPGLRYTSDLSDDELARRFRDDPSSLGSISVGFADQGRLINGVPLGDGEAWTVARKDLAWGAQETIDALTTAFTKVREEFPGAVARLSHIGLQSGGWVRPHKSHQSGRDADIGFFYKGDGGRPGGRLKSIAKAFDAPRNWALLKALVTQTDVQVVWVDRAIQKLLRSQALAQGEDEGWLGRIFQGGKQSLVQHARRHQDHFHVRFYAPRSQELGRRIQPILATRPEHNLAVHKVLRGQTLGHIARKYGVTVAALKKANHLKRTFLAANQRLLVPLHGPCTKCPLPPPVEVPPRCLPPEPQAPAEASGEAGGAGAGAASAALAP